MAEKLKISEELKQKLKKYAIFVLMAIVCAGCIWLIFSPSEKDKAKEQIGMGFNADIPEPKKDGIVGDKMSAYEQEQIEQRQKDRMQSLQGYADMLENSKSQRVSIDLGDEPQKRKVASDEKASINNSVSAYRDINKTLGNFYEKPKDDPEKEEMKKKLEELESKINEKENKQSAVDEQLVLMEKSYEMAAKYMPQGQNQPSENESLSKRIAKGSSNNGKTIITPIKQVREQTVSALHQQFSNDELFVQYDQVRNFGFNTMDEKESITEKNTISAIVDNDQTIVDGQSVRLRLTEPLMAGSTIIPENTIITGMAKIQGERLGILIASIEHDKTILPVEMTVFDSDGQKGIYIPGSLEMDALKEIAANMGQSVGTSFSITQSAGQQIASDLTKGLMQGTSQYLTKKIRQVKVKLKSGYKLMLMPKENQ
ncbi:conjugative transposon protein TraM [Dysgonomonas sp. 520]|uniref:conjugative transposon protein TraM n=1 Tax=Dysgonomonas sp. 520 TaxID=2302931 RepID=UPI0013D154F3|nr:conjugative transposon protein TraM [Dysgonomonas sp. 520]MDL2302819.1 conjugative transposon protein TraM [Dysgonomonas sp. OttesenSCG-928-D17]NDW09819.1 conjugative transposon protein TraM [Dysgonomonas sp. 520]